MQLFRQTIPLNPILPCCQMFPQPQSLFPGLFFYDYIESPNPKKNPEGPTPQAPNPTNKKTPTPKTLFKTQTLKLHPPSHHKN